MEENPDRMLEKLDLILNLIRVCNSTLERIASRGEIRHIDSIPSDGVREPEVVDKTKPELEPESLDELEPDLEVVDESDPEPKVEESLIKTHVDLPVEHVMKLSPSLSAKRVSLSLRPPNVYDSLQIFLHEAVLHVFGISVCDLVFIRTDLIYFALFTLLKLHLTAANLSRKLVPPPPWLRLDASVSLSRPPPWPD